MRAKRGDEHSNRAFAHLGQDGMSFFKSNCISRSILFSAFRSLFRERQGVTRGERCYELFLDKAANRGLKSFIFLHSISSVSFHSF
mmetsp:Transcript_5632/g.7498  ORF Transcript_5632/g.7498 Transcript_5632/m.7498 type:complete len:86 (-) Transcript_5632:687-944(-)